MKTTNIFALVGISILITALGMATAGEKVLHTVEVPLPEDLRIVPPAEDIPKEIAAFSGVWEGESPYGHFDRKQVLVVEEINTKEARIIWAVGSVSGFYESPARYHRATARVIPEKRQIKFALGAREKFIFSIESNLKEIIGVLKEGKNKMKKLKFE
jgi:hypothetical protein